MPQGREVSASSVQSLINKKSHPSEIAKLDDGEDYFSKEAQRLLDNYKAQFFNSSSTSGASSASDVRSGDSGSGTSTNNTPTDQTKITDPPATTNPFNDSLTYLEGGLNLNNIYGGLGSNLMNEFGLSGGMLNGLTIADRNDAVDMAKAGVQYKMDYGLTTLKGDIDKELARMQYENDQLKTDKMNRTEIWLNRNNNLAAGTQARIGANAQMLSNV